MSLQLKTGNRQAKSGALPEACPTHKSMAIACCCAAMTSLAPVALVQLKVLDDLPDPPGRIFNSKRLVTSKDAYHFGIPDGLLGLGSYGITLALLIAAQPSRPVLRKALQAKVALDATMAIRKVRRQVAEHERICSWCVGAAVATAGMMFFARKLREVERPHLV